MTHTSIQHLIDDKKQTEDTIFTADDFIADEDSDAVVSSSAHAPPSVLTGGKESSPLKLSTEVASSPEDGKEAESSEENAKEESGEKSERPKIKQIPTNAQIDGEAAKAGLKAAPSATPFPSVYDVKVPLLSDEEIIKDLKESPLTGKRWLAELGKYILWQARIQLRKIGDKTVRQRRQDDPSLITKMKRIFWY